MKQELERKKGTNRIEKKKKKKKKHIFPSQFQEASVSSRPFCVYRTINKPAKKKSRQQAVSCDAVKLVRKWNFETKGVDVSIDPFSTFLV